MNVDELREGLAELQHEIWSDWMRYLFSVCTSWGEDADTVLISSTLAARWKRQMNTAYADLSESEKDSDRNEADKVIAFLDAREGNDGAV